MPRLADSGKKASGSAINKIIKEKAHGGKEIFKVV